MLKVAIVGRTNVGKSALFNRLLHNRFSVVSKQENTTRNNLMGKYESPELNFFLMDTGGLTKKDNEYYEQILESVKTQLTSFDVILFVVDYKIGITLDDKKIATLIHRLKLPVLLCVNKYDSLQDENYEFLKLGFSSIAYISVLHAINISLVFDFIKQAQDNKSSLATIDEDNFKLCFLGLPNVGKSSLFNYFLDKDRSIVSSTPRTTRNIVVDNFSLNNNTYKVTDTAGVIRRAKMRNNTERLYYEQALSAVRGSDIVLLIHDCAQEFSQLFLKLASVIKQNYRAVILLVNKVDLWDQKNERQEYLKLIQKKLYFLPIYATLFVSAITGENLQRVLPKCHQLKERLTFQFSTNYLNSVLKQFAFITNLQSFGKHKPVFKHIRQLPDSYLSFLVFVKNLNNFTTPQQKYFYKSFVNLLQIDNLPVKLIYKPWKK